MCAGPAPPVSGPPASGPPMSASPSVSRCTPPAAGPPATWISTTPRGSGRRLPAALPRLTTQPCRMSDSASVWSGGTSCWSTKIRVPAAPPAGVRGPGNRSTPGGGAAGIGPVCSRRSSSPAISATGVAGSASSSTSACRRIAGETTVSASRIVVLPPARQARASVSLLERRRELGVGLVEGLGRGVEVRRHAVQALHHLLGTLGELVVRLLELLAGGVGDVPALHQLVDHGLQAGQVAVDLLLAAVELGGGALHLVVRDVNVWHDRDPFGVFGGGSRCVPP